MLIHPLSNHLLYIVTAALWNPTTKPVVVNQHISFNMKQIFAFVLVALVIGFFQSASATGHPSQKFTTNVRMLILNRQAETYMSEEV